MLVGNGATTLLIEFKLIPNCADACVYSGRAVKGEMILISCASTDNLLVASTEKGY
jgi:hypothetical protein